MSETIEVAKAEVRSPGQTLEQTSATQQQVAPEPPSYTEDFDAVLKAELAFVTKEAEGPLSGLAISGGGIRSASFGMGVMQSLVAAGQLDKFHYLSTVSGGGYLGSSLTWFLKQGLPNRLGGSFPAGTTADDFPFGARNRPDEPPRPGESTTDAAERAKREAARAESQNAILNYIRQHAQYLTPTPQLNFFSLLAVVLRATFVSLSVYFALLTGVMGALIRSGLLSPLTSTSPGWITGWFTEFTHWFTTRVPFVNWSSPLWNPLLVISVLGAALLGWMSLVYSFLTRVAPVGGRYRMRTAIQRNIGYISAAIIALVVLGVLPLAYYAVVSLSREYFNGGATVSSIVAGVGSTLLGTLLGASEGRQQAQASNKSSLLDAIRPPAAVGLLLYGLLLTSLVTADQLLNKAPLGWIVLSCLGVLFGLITNLNYLGVHRMYRDRLMELFTPSRKAIREFEWALARDADETAIETLCRLPDGKCRRPYHLINANIVLVDSKTADFRGRGGDSFVLSPMVCGSRATGWVRSSEYMRSVNGMSLPSAMAISGAAVNPNTGVAGRGVTRGRVVSMLLTLLNLRLGYWAPNPRPGWSPTPNFLVPGLWAGLFAQGLHEKARLVELTDGGHFENLGIYELVRRKAKYIVVSDGSADEKYEFSDLANAVERVRVDFGVKIEFKGDFPLNGILAGSGPTQPASLDAKFCLARHGFAEGSIRYPGDDAENPSGKIIYLKGTIIPKLPADVLGYKAAHPAFPHESTGDQFFDEEQFEAYRELGYHIGWQWLESVKKRKKRAAEKAAEKAAKEAAEKAMKAAEEKAALAALLPAPPAPPAPESPPPSEQETPAASVVTVPSGVRGHEDPTGNG